MARKEIKFPFGDGVQSLKLGQLVFVADNYRRRGDSPGCVYKVTSIGVKYVTVTHCGRNLQFRIDDGSYISNITRYYSLYSSESEYGRIKGEELYVCAVKKKFVKEKLNYDQAKKISEIFGWSNKELKEQL